jgi:cysteine desulfurase
VVIGKFMPPEYEMTGRDMIYLDHNATTPILPEVLEAMMPYLTTEWGNPSSSYKFGSRLKSVIETARAHVAELINAHPSEIIFTSCGTESNNAAIHSALKANLHKRHIVTIPYPQWYTHQ